MLSPLRLTASIHQLYRKISPGGIDFKLLSSQYVTATPPAQSPWYVYVGAIIEATASPQYIGDLWRYLSTEFKDQETQLQVARRLREGLLKTSVLAGFPRGVNALAALRTALNDVTPAVGKILEEDKSMRGPLSADITHRRGQEFFEKVYQKLAPKVMDNLARSSGGDLSQFAVYSVYGELMAETSILDDKETGLLEFVVCYATHAVPQAKGHMYGARNLGNSKTEIQSAIKLVRALMSTLKIPLDESSMNFTKKMEKW